MTSEVPARPSAGIGMVDAEKLRMFYDFWFESATLCGDWSIARNVSKLLISLLGTRASHFVSRFAHLLLEASSPGLESCLFSAA